MKVLSIYKVLNTYNEKNIPKTLGDILNLKNIDIQLAIEFLKVGEFDTLEILYVTDLDFPQQTHKTFGKTIIVKKYIPFDQDKEKSIISIFCGCCYDYIKIIEIDPTVFGFKICHCFGSFNSSFPISYFDMILFNQKKYINTIADFERKEYLIYKKNKKKMAKENLNIWKKYLIF